MSAGMQDNEAKAVCNNLARWIRKHGVHVVLGSFARQRPFIRGDRLAQFLGMSEDHDWLVECEACESEGCKECVVNVGACLMRKEKPKCGRAIML